MAAGSELPRDVLEFLARFVGSVGELEVLLLLHGERESAWTAAATSAKLYRPESWVAGQLERQLANKLLVREPGPPPRYRWAPTDEALNHTVERVAVALRTRPTRIIDAVHGQRRTSAERFADAFRLRESDDERGSG